MSDKVAENITREDLLEAKLLAEKGEDAIREAEELGDAVRMTRAELARTFFLFDEESSQSTAQSRFEVLFQSSADALMTLEPPDWRFTSGNPAAVKMFGAKDEEDFKSHAPWEYSPAFQSDGQPSSNKAREMIMRAMDEGSHYFEWMHRKIGGPDFPATVLLTRFVLNHREVLQATVRDTSERKQLENQLLQSHRMEAIGQLSGGIAHDFNNLLSVILGQAALARQDLGENHPVSADMEEIQKAGLRAAELVSQLLAYSGRQVLNPKTLVIRECLSNLERMSKSAIPEDIKLSFTINGSLDSIKVDPVQFERALLNLLVNARDAMPDGGELSVSASNKYVSDADRKQFRNLQTGRHVQIVVKDTGMGISPEHLSRVFDPFFTTKGHRGTGLGLASVYGIVQQSGGDITVESTVGHGTAFTLLFPSAKHASTPPPASQRSPEVYKCEGNIIVVEDEEMLRKASKRILERIGLKVVTFDGAKAVFSFFDEKSEETFPFSPEEVDLIISDVKMPGMNGPILIEELRKRGFNKKVLFVSGHAEETHRIDSSKSPFLQKPYTNEELADTVKRLLPPKREKL